jgi:hypothetical protein
LNFFLKFFEYLINGKYPYSEPEMDLDPGSQLVRDSPDPDPQHCKKSMYNKINTSSLLFDIVRLFV